MIKDKRVVMKDLGRVLRRKIIIQQKIVEENEVGDPMEQWVDWKPMWAERNSLWGADYYAAAAVHEEHTVEFVVRCAPFLRDLSSALHRILFDGRAYDIKHIDYLQDDDMWIKIKALEVTGRGKTT